MNNEHCPGFTFYNTSAEPDASGPSGIERGSVKPELCCYSDKHVCHASEALRTSRWRDKGEEKRFTQEADRDEVCRYENTGASPYTRESLIY